MYFECLSLSTVNCFECIHSNRLFWVIFLVHVLEKCAHSMCFNWYVKNRCSLCKTVTLHARIFGFRWHNNDESRVITIEMRDLSIGNIRRGNVYFPTNDITPTSWKVDRISSCDGKNGAIIRRPPFLIENSERVYFNKSIEQWMNQ